MGFRKKNVYDRSQAKLKRAINRWARKHDLKVVRVGPKRTYCKKGTARVHCTSAARVCP